MFFAIYFMYLENDLNKEISGYIKTEERFPRFSRTKYTKMLDLP